MQATRPRSTIAIIIGVSARDTNILEVGYHLVTRGVDPSAESEPEKENMKGPANHGGRAENNVLF